MKTRKFLIAGGNSTALISECCENREDTSKRLLEEVEQVGFISENKLEMMGGELCINGTLALASTLGKKGILYTSGIEEKIEYTNREGLTTIAIPQNYKKQDNIILFNGIGFICLPKEQESQIKKEFLGNLSTKYNLPAFGAIFYEQDRITPYVYVQSVDSYVKETACGSGSIAYSLFSGFKTIIQPTNKTININIKKDKIFITAEVKEETWNQ